MPISFNPPANTAHVPHAPRAHASADDDASLLDAFTALLLAAANVQDDAPASDAKGGDGQDAQAAAGITAPADPAALLTLPLPPLGQAVIDPQAGVRDVRLRSARAGDESVAATGRSSAAAAATAPLLPLPAAQPQAATAAATAAALLDPAPERAPADAAAHAGRLSPFAALGQKGAESSHAAAAANPANALPTAALEVLAAHADARTASAKGSAESAPPPLVGAAHAGVGTAVAAPQPAHVETLATPAFAPGWHDEAAGRIAQIVVTRQERAELKLNPAELGPVNIRVEMQADQASVTIVAASAETRSALEQSLPQLRDMLAGQGIALAQANVQDGSAQREPPPSRYETAARQDAAAGGDAGPAAVTVVTRRIDRLVDVFA